jgi:hypothetical protein
VTAHKKVREKQKESSLSEKEEKERSISEKNQRLLLVGIAVWPSEPASKGLHGKTGSLVLVFMSTSRLSGGCSESPLPLPSRL